MSEPENGVPASSVTLGAMALSWETSVIPFCCRVLAVTAVTAIGTFWMFWLVFCEVTTTSSTVLLSVAVAARAGAASITQDAIMVDATSPDLNALMVPPFLLFSERCFRFRALMSHKP